jgi:hypothetical protein
MPNWKQNKPYHYQGKKGSLGKINGQEIDEKIELDEIKEILKLVDEENKKEEKEKRHKKR